MYFQDYKQCSSFFTHKAKVFLKKNKKKIKKDFEKSKKCDIVCDEKEKSIGVKRMKRTHISNIGLMCSMAVIMAVYGSSANANIPSTDPTCDNATLGVYSGSAALEPDWGANRINLRWYDNNTLMTVTSAESECEYDGAIDVVTAPSRTGYNFSGWRVRQQVDFAALRPTLTFASTQERWSVGAVYGTGARYCWHAVHTNSSVSEACSLRAEYTDMEANEWKTETGQGMIYGSAHCSAKAGNHHNGSWSTTYKSDWSATIAELDEVSGDKNYCWCQVTGFKPTNASTIQGPLASLSWVFRGASGSASVCSSICANYCSSYVRNYSGFRAALFSN